jgi:hypothetical protein
MNESNPENPIISESLWILTNLACEQENTQRLFEDFNIIELIGQLFLNNFINFGEANGNSESQDFEPSSKLSETHLNLLEQMLWFTGNVAADSDNSKYFFLRAGIDKCLSLILKKYHAQFNANIWRVYTWVMSILSLGLRSISSSDESKYEPFNI